MYTTMRSVYALFLLTKQNKINCIFNGWFGADDGVVKVTIRAGHKIRLYKICLDKLNTYTCTSNRAHTSFDCLLNCVDVGAVLHLSVEHKSIC